MKVNVQKQKEHALKLLQQFIKYKPIIDMFKDEDQVTFSEGLSGATYVIDGESKLVEAIERLKKKGYLPYHANHAWIQGMEMWSIMVVSPYEDDWEYDLEEAESGYAFCWVENVDVPDFSEFGTVTFKPSMAGDVIRIG